MFVHGHLLSTNKKPIQVYVYLLKCGDRRHGEAWEEKMMSVSLRASYICCLTLRMTNCSSFPGPEGFQGWSWENKGIWSPYKLDKVLCEWCNEIWWQEGIPCFYSVRSGNIVLLWPTKACYFRSTYINVIVVEPVIEAVLRSSSHVTASSRSKWGIPEGNYMKIKCKARDTSGSPKINCTSLKWFCSLCIVQMQHVSEKFEFLLVM